MWLFLGFVAVFVTGIVFGVVYDRFFTETGRRIRAELNRAKQTAADNIRGRF